MKKIGLLFLLPIGLIIFFIVWINLSKLVSEPEIKYGKDFITYYTDASRDEEVEVPNNLKEIFEEVGDKHGISPEFMEALSYVMTGFNVDAEDGVHKGLLLVNVEVYSQKNWQDPKLNIESSAQYMEDIIKRYNCGDGGDIVKHYYNGSEEIAERVENLTLILERKHNK